MILTFTFLVAFAIAATGALVGYITITEPTRDVSNIMDKVFALLTGIVGALLGLLAGRGEAASAARRKEDRTP